MQTAPSLREKIASACAGRPRQMSENERRGALVAAAEALFLSKGYHAATMADVARQAGMSKKTLYQFYATKSELFETLLSDWKAPFALPVESDGRPPREVLTDVLCRLINFALAERQVAITRLLIAESRQSGEIALAMDRQGIGRASMALEHWLASQATLGLIAASDAERTAKMLFFAAAGDLLFGLLLRTHSCPDPLEVRARVERAVALFLS